MTKISTSALTILTLAIALGLWATSFAWSDRPFGLSAGPSGAATLTRSGRWSVAYVPSMYIHNTTALGALRNMAHRGLQTW